MREAMAFFQALGNIFPPDTDRLPVQVLERFDEACKVRDAAAQRWLRLDPSEIREQEEWIRSKMVDH